MQYVMLCADSQGSHVSFSTRHDTASPFKTVVCTRLCLCCCNDTQVPVWPAGVGHPTTPLFIRTSPQTILLSEQDLVTDSKQLTAVALLCCNPVSGCNLFNTTLLRCAMRLIMQSKKSPYTTFTYRHRMTMTILWLGTETQVVQKEIVCNKSDLIFGASPDVGYEVASVGHGIPHGFVQV